MAAQLQLGPGSSRVASVGAIQIGHSGGQLQPAEAESRNRAADLATATTRIEHYDLDLVAAGWRYRIVLFPSLTSSPFAGPAVPIDDRLGPGTGRSLYRRLGLVRLGRPVGH